MTTDTIDIASATAVLECLTTEQLDYEIACRIVRGIVDADLPPAEARVIASELTIWWSQTDENRWAAVAAEMIADGWPCHLVADSIDRAAA